MSPDELPDEALRSALELAVGVAAAAPSVRPALAIPPGLRPYLRQQRLSGTALGSVRAAIEGDAQFRERLAAVANDDLVDEVGRLWLARPDGWAERLDEAFGARPPDADPGALRRAERRREAAERSAFKAKAEVAALLDEAGRDRATRRESAALVAQLREELAATRAALGDARRSSARERARAEVASTSASSATVERDAATRVASEAEAARDRALAARAARSNTPEPGAVATPAAAARALEQAAEACAQLARSLAEAAAALSSAPPGIPPRSDGPSRRRPIAIPGGTYGDSGAAAEHVLRTPGVVAVLDGYNIAKLGWPALSLADQRERCILAAEMVARRWGTETVVVFDGADVLGASTTSRRLVRVRFSPAGVSADDVIRAEVASLAADVPVTVVTNDQAIVQDVRAQGASVISSDRWLAVAVR